MIDKIRRGAIAAALALAATGPAAAQKDYPTLAPGVRAPGLVNLQCDARSANCAPVTPLQPLWTAGKQEAFLLVSGNVAGSDQSADAPAGGDGFTAGTSTSLFGGSYAFTQLCSGYGVGGAVSLQQYYAPGATWLTLAMYGTADTQPHVLPIQGNAIVRAAIVGSPTACTATLVRIPA